MGSGASFQSSNRTKKILKSFDLTDANSEQFFVTTCNAEKTIKSNINNNVTNFQVNGFTK